MALRRVLPAVFLTLLLPTVLEIRYSSRKHLDSAPPGGGCELPPHYPQRDTYIWASSGSLREW